MVSVKGRVSKCIFPSPCPTISSPQGYMLAQPQLLFLLQVKIRSASKSHWENIPDIYHCASKSLTHHTSLGAEKKSPDSFKEVPWYKRLGKYTIFRCVCLIGGRGLTNRTSTLQGLSYFVFCNLVSKQEGRGMISLEQSQHRVGPQ